MTNAHSLEVADHMRISNARSACALKALRCLTAALLTCALFTVPARGAYALPFPGAEGFGGDTQGGTGGKTLWVTNLNANGPGSLREAVDTPGARVIRFKVAGEIELEREPLRIGFPFRAQYNDLVKAGAPADKIENPYSFVTIDGADAPPPGVTLHGSLYVGGYGTQQVIIRNLRIRDNGFIGRSGADCITIMGSHVLVDHCSLQGARDEVVNPWYAEAHHITIQWCLIGPGWGPHGYGFVNGGGTDAITLHHNLFAHNRSRNPLLCGNSRANWIGKFANDTPILDCRNNVAYNWENIGAASLTAGAHVNMVGNLFLPGADSADHAPLISATSDDHTKPTVLYLKGNIGPHRPKDDMDEWAEAGHQEKAEQGWKAVYGPWQWGQKSETPFPAPPVVTHSAEEARALVLSQAGAWPRDAVDAGVVRTVLQRSGYVAVDNTLPSDFTNAKPSASASAEQVQGGAPLSVSFHGQGQDPDGKVAFCTWDFGDGQRAVGADASHTYPIAGEYVAMLFVTDDQGMGATASLRVRVSKDGVVAEPIPPPPPGPPAPPPAQTKWQPPTVALAAPIAGPLRDGHWSNAPRLMPFIDQATWKKTPDGKVDARILHDRESLYLRLVCSGFQADAVKPFETLSSPPRHWREGRSHDGIIIFFSPRYGESLWYRFDVGVNGERYDAKGPDRGWNPSPDWRFRSVVANNRWDVTVAIPLSAIEARPEKGQTWGLKIIVGTEKDDLCIWPPVGPAGPDMFCVPETSAPCYYARLQVP